MEPVQPPAAPPARFASAEHDAAAILRRAEEDERAAEALRGEIQANGLASVPPDELITPRLEPGETVAAMRPAVVEHVGHDGAVRAWTARLYVTSRRVALLGGESFAVPLSEIDEISVAGERILLALHDGTGIGLDAGSPRVLRVLIAAARAGAGHRAPGAPEIEGAGRQPDSR